MFSELEMQMFSALEGLGSKTSHKPGSDLHRREGFLWFFDRQCHVKTKVQSTRINGPEKKTCLCMFITENKADEFTCLISIKTHAVWVL